MARNQIKWENQPLPNFNAGVIAQANAGRMMVNGINQLAGVFDKRAAESTAEQQRKNQATEDAFKAQLLQSPNQADLLTAYANQDRSSLDGTQQFGVAQTFADQRDNLQPDAIERELQEIGYGDNQKIKGYFDAQGNWNNQGSPYDIRKGNSISIDNRSGGGNDGRMPNLYTTGEREILGLSPDSPPAGPDGKGGIAYYGSKGQIEGDKNTEINKAKRLSNFEPSMTSNQESIDGVNTTIDILTNIQNESGITNTGLASLLDFIPHSPMKDFKERVETVKARLGFGKLAEMKALSSTGGSGLGQLSDKEMMNLQKYYGSLDTAQSPAQFIEAITGITGILNQSKGRYTKQRASKIDWYNQNRREEMPEWVESNNLPPEQKYHYNSEETKAERLQQLEAKRAGRI